MSERLNTSVAVSAVVRLTQAAGGFAAILAKGDPTAGAMLFVTCEKGRITGLFERILSPDGRYMLGATGPQDIENETEIHQYLAIRRRNDPDLWLIELDIPDGPRFVAQLSAFD